MITLQKLFADEKDYEIRTAIKSKEEITLPDDMDQTFKMLLTW
jgi:hypothetical protein